MLDFSQLSPDLERSCVLFEGCGWLLQAVAFEFPSSVDPSESSAVHGLDDLNACFRIVCDGEYVAHFDNSAPLHWWLNVVAIDPPADLVDVLSSLPDLPSDVLASGLPVSISAVSVASALAAPPAVSADLLRPDGSEWSAAAVREILRGDTFSESVHSSHYQGVLAHIKPKSRLIVSPSGSSFVLQTRSMKKGLEVWGNVSGGRSKSRAALLAKCEFVGLKKALRDCPERPADALPEFVKFRSAQTAAFAMNDTRRDDYRRVIVSTPRLRLIVSPCGEKYLAQGARPDASFVAPDDWQLLLSFDTCAGLSAWVAAQSSLDGAVSVVEALKSLPERLFFGDWSDLPNRPQTVPLDRPSLRKC